MRTVGLGAKKPGKNTADAKLNKEIKELKTAYEQLKAENAKLREEYEQLKAEKPEK